MIAMCLSLAACQIPEAEQNLIKKTYENNYYVIRDTVTNKLDTILVLSFDFNHCPVKVMYSRYNDGIVQGLYSFDYTNDSLFANKINVPAGYTLAGYMLHLEKEKLLQELRQSKDLRGEESDTETFKKELYENSSYYNSDEQLLYAEEDTIN